MSKNFSQRRIAPEGDEKHFFFDTCASSMLSTGQDIYHVSDVRHKKMMSYTKLPSPRKNVYYRTRNNFICIVLEFIGQKTGVFMSQNIQTDFLFECIYIKTNFEIFH